MQNLICFFFVLLFIIPTNSYKPIIAIFGNSQPDTDFTQNNKDYVTGTYPRWIQESGGEVIVIHPWHTETEVDTILSKVNGVLFQGGGREFDLSSRWEMLAAKIIMKSMQYQTEGEIFSIWGTCQGFQLILTILANEKILENYNDWIKLHKTIFNEKTIKARIHSLFEKKDFDLLENHDSTIYFHHYGLSVNQFKKYEKLVNVLDITSLGEDDDKKEFINSIEAKDANLPIFAVQYHPEKNPYNRQNTYSLPHNTDARKISQLLSLFFISETRKSKHRMEESERKNYDFISSYSQGNYDFYDDNTYYFSQKKNKNVS